MLCTANEEAANLYARRVIVEKALFQAEVISELNSRSSSRRYIWYTETLYDVLARCQRGV
jgi:hypothetical protein